MLDEWDDQSLDGVDELMMGGVSDDDRMIVFVADKKKLTSDASLALCRGVLWPFAFAVAILIVDLLIYSLEK